MCKSRAWLCLKCAQWFGHNIFSQVHGIFHLMAEQTDRHSSVLLEVGKAEIHTKLPARKVLSRFPLLSIIYPLPAPQSSGTHLDSRSWGSGRSQSGRFRTLSQRQPSPWLLGDYPALSLLGSQIHSRRDAQHRGRVLGPLREVGKGWPETTFTFGAQVTRPIPFLI